MDGFRKTDREQILACLTDDVVWKIPGAFETNGKAAFSGHIVDEGFKRRPPALEDNHTQRTRSARSSA